MGDVKLADIPLAPLAPGYLAKAQRLMAKHRDEAMETMNVANTITVGRYTHVELDEICHAHMDDTLPWLPDDQRVDARYLVNFATRGRRREYYSGEDVLPFAGYRLQAVREYWHWLANYSHWARFFVGDKDIDTLANYGSILDLSAPSFVVHFMSVAMRMPHEYVELCEHWHYLVMHGVEPHLAFACAQNTGGWDQEYLDWFYPNGHNLIGTLSRDGVARITWGVVQASAEDMRQARRGYSLYIDRCYEAGANSFQRRDESRGWWQSWGARPPEFVKQTTIKDYWGGDEVQTQVLSAAFQSPFDLGWRSVMDSVVKIGKANDWR